MQKTPTFFCKSPFVSNEKAFCLLRNRVIAAASPRIAAKNAFDCEKAALEWSVLLYCLKGILRTSRGKPTSRRRMWRNGCLIEPYKQNKQPRKKLLNDFHSLPWR